jgi:preprotein translocase subunit SecE
MIDKIVHFLREVREELRKVTWPTRYQTVRLTLIVIGVSLAVGVYLSALDFILTKLMGVGIK